MNETTMMTLLNYSKANNDARESINVGSRHRFEVFKAVLDKNPQSQFLSAGQLQRRCNSSSPQLTLQ